MLKSVIIPAIVSILVTLFGKPFAEVIKNRQENSNHRKERNQQAIKEFYQVIDQTNGFILNGIYWTFDFTQTSQYLKLENRLSNDNKLKLQTLPPCVPKPGYGFESNPEYSKDALTALLRNLRADIAKFESQLLLK